MQGGYVNIDFVCPQWVNMIAPVSLLLENECRNTTKRDMDRKQNICRFEMAPMWQKDCAVFSQTCDAYPLNMQFLVYSPSLYHGDLVC